MNSFRRMSAALSALLVVTVTFLGFPMTAQGALITTQEVIAERAAVDRALLLATLDRADVQQQLVDLGVDVQQAKDRVAAMTDEELELLNGKLKEMPAGGDVIGAVVLIFLVLLITDIAGFTDIFPFVKKRR